MKNSITEEIKMLKRFREGYTIRIQLPEECGHVGYYVKCTYKYNKKIDKYTLDMWLMYNDIDDEFQIKAQEIDKQNISGTRDTIEDNICKIVEYASLSGYFEESIKRFEYTYKCFDRGNELFERERLCLRGKDWQE